MTATSLKLTNIIVNNNPLAMNTHKDNIRSNFITSSLHHIITIFLCICASVLTLPLYAQAQKPWQWVKQLGGPSWDIAGGVAIDSKNNLYVAGTFSQTLHADSKKVISAGGSDLFLARFDTKGNISNLWGFGGKGQDEAVCIAITPNNNVIMGGTLTDNATFGKLKSTGAGPQLFLTAIDSKGNALWITSMSHQGSASLYLLDADSMGNIYAAGSFSGTLACGDKKVVSRGKSDIFLLSLNSSGILNRLISFGSEEDEEGRLPFQAILPKLLAIRRYL
jgi:hypothetical protein